ncbi:TetR/AcrR family transcriptional regulator [Pseudoalteromonas sp. T1lg88]|uniref:TetR/AcrR family transcriptional regulator n=1 Tax=Pseudoalteromonas sp. T1lg88 TaxID=2077104 RepID=UPI000CF654D3|nr:TetR/AcrR family transcriptional regulator [Pseudoalteromonas sp. T1lg88]
MSNNEFSHNKGKAKRGRPAGDHDSKRKQLVSAVIEVLCEQGHRGTSMRKVSAKVGSSTGTMTYYFKNKEEMITAATDFIFEEYEQLLINDGKYLDIRDTLDNWLMRAQNESKSTAPVFSELLIYARNEPNFARYLLKKYEKLKSILTLSIEQGQLEGAIRKDISAKMLCDQLTALVDGWLVIQSINIDEFDPEHTQNFVSATLKLMSPYTVS